jgi:hypothetical protein
LVFNKELASFEGLEYQKGNFFRPVFGKEKKLVGYLNWFVGKAPDMVAIF